MVQTALNHNRKFFTDLIQGALETAGYSVHFVNDEYLQFSKEGHKNIAYVVFRNLSDEQYKETTSIHAEQDKFDKLITNIASDKEETYIIYSLLTKDLTHLEVAIVNLKVFDGLDIAPKSDSGKLYSRASGNYRYNYAKIDTATNNAPLHRWVWNLTTHY